MRAEEQIADGRDDWFGSNISMYCRCHDGYAAG
jgi:hypothetical protein